MEITLPKCKNLLKNSQVVFSKLYSLLLTLRELRYEFSSTSVFAHKTNNKKNKIICNKLLETYGFDILKLPCNSMDVPFEVSSSFRSSFRHIPAQFQME